MNFDSLHAPSLPARQRRRCRITHYTTATRLSYLLDRMGFSSYFRPKALIAKMIVARSLCIRPPIAGSDVRSDIDISFRVRFDLGVITPFIVIFACLQYFTNSFLPDPPHGHRIHTAHQCITIHTFTPDSTPYDPTYHEFTLVSDNSIHVHTVTLFLLLRNKGNTRRSIPCCYIDNV